MPSIGYRTMSAGYLISAMPRKSSYDDPAHVRLHKLGTSETSFFRPIEGRDLAEKIYQATFIAQTGDAGGEVPALVPQELIDLLTKIRYAPANLVGDTVKTWIDDAVTLPKPRETP